jgi:threonine dehydrogenase-like Zn-dependent dehydrogenase
MREAVSLLGSGQVNVKPLISGRFSLDDIEEAFQASLTGIKVVVEP